MNRQTNNVLRTGLIALALAAMPVGNAFAQQAASEFSAVKLTWQQRTTEEMAKRIGVLAELIGSR